MKTSVVAALLLLAASVFGCKEDVLPAAQPINVAYNETQCADPWQQGSNDAETLRNIENFFREKGINFSATAILPAPSGLIVCLACNCPSGRIILGKVSQEDLVKIERYGFKVHR